MVFKSLGAYDACSRVGKIYQSQTFSFASAELSTSRGVHDEFGILHYPYSYAWTAFNYAEITNSYVSCCFVNSQIFRSVTSGVGKIFTYISPGVVQNLLLIQSRRNTTRIPKV